MGRIVYPDWYVEWIDGWARSFILLGMWNRLSCGLMTGSLRGLTCSIPDRYVVSPALRGLTCSIPARYVVSPVAFLIVTWSHLSVFRIVTEATKQQLQRPEVLQERCRGQETAVAVSGGVAGALQRPESSNCSVRERCRSVAAARNGIRSGIRDVAMKRSSCEAAQPRIRSVAGTRHVADF